MKNFPNTILGIESKENNNNSSFIKKNNKENKVFLFDNDKQEDELEIKQLIENIEEIINVNAKKRSFDEYDRCIDHIKLSLNDNENKYKEEILSILNKPLSDKNSKKLIFKPLYKPKKVSLIGKVFGDIPSNDTTQDN